MTSLNLLGWNSFFESQLSDKEKQNLKVGRIAAEHRTEYVVLTEEGEARAKVRGRLHYNAESGSDLPAVGDWVCLSLFEGEGMIERCLDRKTKFSRKVPGAQSEEQIIATNIDVAFIVASLSVELNQARLERYLSAVVESGSTPVFVLTKTDLCEDVEGALAVLKAFAPSVETVAVNSLLKEGIEPLLRYLQDGKTGVLVGPSGVGKSTLVNALADSNVLDTANVRESDGKGRHTTTHRELVLLPCGGCLVDTPGMREFQMWDSASGIESVFADIEALSKSCKFSDCTHSNEPGCAISNALVSGELDGARFESFRKLERENAYLMRRNDKAKQSEERQKWKQVSMSLRRQNKAF